MVQEWLHADSEPAKPLLEFAHAPFVLGNLLLMPVQTFLELASSGQKLRDFVFRIIFQ